MNKTKYCPDLTEYEEERDVLINRYYYKRPILNECIKEKCVAYSNKACIKYASCTEYEETEDENKIQKIG